MFAVSHPNEIWGHRFLTGMTCMIYKEIRKAFILNSLLPISLKS